MDDLLDPAEPSSSSQPPLPAPALPRWQPLRLGLVELFHYDSEEFWFRDGHLLLRGNNGAGKSKILSLTLPFLLDAQLKSSRIEPDGDSTKKMAWNLLMNSYDRRIGYAWIEFGRIAEDGAAHFLTLGAGLSAYAARPQVDSWYFILDGGAQAPRINRDIWLTSTDRIVLTRDRLRTTIDGRGQIFDTGAAYRRAVDERLFHLGPRRYDALVDTLIQLRQPQLSKKPDEASLSNALTEALPPLAAELLGDVAEALGQLEEDRRQLDDYQALAKAVGRFDARYRIYAGTQSRRQARIVRQAQTEFDSASRARSDAQAQLETARTQEADAVAGHEAADLALTHQRARLDMLLSDPAMQDANRLDHAEKDARARDQTMKDAEAARLAIAERLDRAIADSRQWAERLARTEAGLAAIRRTAAGHAGAAGIANAFARNALAAGDTPTLIALTPPAIEAAETDLRSIAETRGEEITVLRRRYAEVAAAEAQHAQHRQALDDAREIADAAARRRAQADAAVEEQGRHLVARWGDHFAGLRQLRLEADQPLVALAEWVVVIEGDNPAQQALYGAQQDASRRLAARQNGLDGERALIAAERGALADERHRIEAGVDAAPPAPTTRAADARDARAGAPFWRLVEFRDDVEAGQRAGVEAALEGAGLLDAWVSPDGRLQGTADGPLLDTQWVDRPAASASLAGWLRPDMAPDCDVAVATVARMLAGIACGPDDPSDCEAWIAPDGRFRLGALAGAWRKPAAAHIGFAARAATRARRLAEIAALLVALDARQAALLEQLAAHEAAQQQADAEWRAAPRDEALRQAHLTAAAAARDYIAARERLAAIDARCRAAEATVRDVRASLVRDATDLRLPEDESALQQVETECSRFNDAQYRIVRAVDDLRLVEPEHRRQTLREAEVRADLEQRTAHAASSRSDAEEASARLAVLRETIGARVEDLKQQLTDARQAVAQCDRTLKTAAETLRKSGEARAIASEKAVQAEDHLLMRTAARRDAIGRLQKFAATGLLASALPSVELPDMATAWTIDPALGVARRAEAALTDLKDDDDAWTRIQRQIAENFDELQRALNALGHQTIADVTDWGLVVQIVYQNRPESPDRLAARLDQEVAQREELLSANERAVLENHLQAEIAAEIQRLLQVAERQVAAINTELHKRPTSTGVRYRLVWQPLAEEEGAPVGLDAARRRLLNTSADLWSAEDRRVVGAMLQQRIAAERERADAGFGRDGGKDGGGSLFDQLARALDYRHWHRFRVERWQDGHWRKLSGPASSGERALGLTVPLFAAVASFYGQSAQALAPRLILLDEAFAGIDDAARAHCMGLIREFDLDFVVTSEREWGCYAELPGVAICQLQRREGIDAVFVSRWTWDGSAKRRDADPDRRFAPA